MKSSKTKRALALLLAGAMVFDGVTPVKALAQERQENVQEEAAAKENTAAEGEAEPADAGTKENEAAKEDAGIWPEEIPEQEEEGAIPEEGSGPKEKQRIKEDVTVEKSGSKPGAEDETSEKEAENLQRAETVRGAEASEGDYAYQELEDGTIEITKYNGAGGEVQIPEEIAGKKVTSIGYDAFYECSGLTGELKLPEGLTSIGNRAFYGCSGLTGELKLPEGLMSIGYRAFYGCSGLTGITVDSKNTKYASEDGILYDKGKTKPLYCPRGKKGNVSIPEGVTEIDVDIFYGCSGLTGITVDSKNTKYASEDGILYNKGKTKLLYCPRGKKGNVSISGSVTSIGDSAFDECSGLTGELKLPEGLMSIGNSAFSGCSSLTSVSIPGSVTSIGAYAFYRCSGLTGELKLPGGLTSIGNEAFNGCSSLTSIAVDSKNTKYASKDGILYNKSRTKLLCCPEGKKGDVSIPESVTKIDEEAFKRCSSLTSVEIPEGVTAIEQYGFQGCSSLTSVEISEGVTEIGYCAFQGCSSLTSINIPKSVTFIWNSFEGCSKLTLNVYRNSYAETYAKREGVPYTFISCKEHTSVIDEAVEPTCGTEGKTEGSHCAVCEEVFIAQESIPPTGEHTPVTDEAVEPTRGKEGRTEGSHCAVCGEIFIEPEIIPATGNHTWKTTEKDDGTLELTKYEGEGGDISVPSKIDGKKVTHIGLGAFVGCDNLTSVTVSENVTYIEDEAFAGCDSLTSVIISKSVTGIGWNVFGGCSSLSEITVDSSNPDYISKDGIVYNRKGTKLICCPPGKMGDISILEGVTSLQIDSFITCDKLMKVEIPKSLTNDDVMMELKQSSSLSEIVVNSSNPAYTSKDGILYDKNGTSLRCCPRGKTGDISIPEGVTSIEQRAFWRCSGLTSVSIPGSVISLEEGVFGSGCDSLARVTILGGVKSIGENAFIGCSNLKSITIPKSVIQIGDHAFGYEYHMNDKTGEEEIVKSSSLPTIYCYENSAAYQYAKKNVMPYQFLDGQHTHTWKTSDVTKATTAKNGVITKICSVCGETKKSTIYYPKTITLAKTKYTYNGKAQKPSVTIKDSKGKTIASSNYAVTYPSGRKNVGTYTVTIKFKNNYTGTVKKTFTIQPKGTSFTGISAKSKGFTAKWKKQSTQTTGYEIQYSTDSKFKKGNKIQDVKKNQTTSQTIKKLKAGKKYYARIRTYKTVKVSGKSKKIYSDWSKAKSVTTKK